MQADPYSDDQGAFNRILTRGLFPVRAFSKSGRVVGPISGFGPDGLRLAPLPADRFCSGHLVWVQQEGEVHVDMAHAILRHIACTRHLLRSPANRQVSTTPHACKSSHDCLWVPVPGAPVSLCARDVH